jgi:hypothetical protein
MTVFTFCSCLESGTENKLFSYISIPSRARARTIIYDDFLDLYYKCRNHILAISAGDSEGATANADIRSTKPYNDMFICANLRLGTLCAYL